jgi:D-glycero-alpha-D-manno-heptose-7-phosphate kinase
MVITRTPFRVSFFGGGTDFPAWYLKNGGAVLATSIDKYCYLTVRYLPPFFEHRYRVVYSKNETCKEISEIQHPPVRAILQEMKFDRGLEIHHDGDLPARSGMGSSSSFAVGLLHALRALRGEAPTRHELALGAIRIEQEILREAVGSQDQILAAHGGLNLVRFQPGGEIAVEPVAIPAKRVQALNDHLLLFFTGVSRTSSQIVAGYIGQLASKEQHLLAYRQMVDEALAILTSERPLREFGELLHEAWQLKRSIGQGVTNDEIDGAYDAARKAGAWGGKLLGAGGGGFLLVFSDPERHEAIKESLGDLLEIPFQFENQGSQIIFVERQIDYSSKDMARQKQSLRPFSEANLPGSPPVR